jgi:magnesium transporter
VTPEVRLALDFIAAHPARAALDLEQMSVGSAAAVLREVPASAAASVLREMPAPHAAACLERLPPEAAATILAAMIVSDGAAVVRACAPGLRERLLAALPRDTAEPFGRVLDHPDGSAGAVMDPSIFQLPNDTIVADARTRLRHAARDLLYYLYVIDREHRLVGVLDIPELMIARPRDPVGAAMHRHVERLSAKMPVALVREHPGWQRYHAMPVVDDDDRLLGAIRYQTLRGLERAAVDHRPDPSLLTARALGELFQLGTTALVAGVVAAAESEGASTHRPLPAVVGEAADA